MECKGVRGCCQYSRDAVVDAPETCLSMHQRREYIPDFLSGRLSVGVQVMLDPAVQGYEAQELVGPEPKVSGP